MRKILFALFLLGLISSASADKDFEDDEFSPFNLFTYLYILSLF